MFRFRKVSEIITQSIEDQKTIESLQRQAGDLKQQIAAMRQQEYDMMRDHEAELQNLFAKYVDPLKQKLEDAEFRVQQLTNSNSHRMFKSVLEKLENVSKRLDLTETVLKNTERMLQDEIIKRDQMRKFIDTLPESYRAAWSVILMKDQEEKE